MTRVDFAGPLLLSLLAGCSSWDTGSNNDRTAEIACLDTCEALARAGERCGLEYKRVYDLELKAIANGDCKNISGIRDEAQLRNVCLTSLSTEVCTKVRARDYDASCSTQLQRTASYTPRL
jgi:hypothetical protein